MNTTVKLAGFVLWLFAVFSPHTGVASEVTGFNYAPKVESHYPKKISGILSWGDLDLQRVRVRDRLIRVAHRYSRLSYVPYIWGGGRIGSRKSCLACRRCVRQKKIDLKSRLELCKPCQQCGIDCSHFVNMVYREAGVPYDYASTWELNNQTPEGLLGLYDLVDLGTKLTHARPGDLLIYEKHMVMLVQSYSEGYGDFVHATRFRGGDKLKLGGFRWDTNKNLKKYRGKLIRVLRHRAFFDSWEEIDRYQQASSLPRSSYLKLIAQLKNFVGY